MKCLLLTRYERIGASSRVRFYQYLPFLNANGVEVEVAPLMYGSYVEDLYAGRPRKWGSIVGAYWRRLLILWGSKQFDCLWVEGELFPWLPSWAEQALAANGVPYVIDLDDAVFHRYDLHPNRLINLCLGRKLDAVMRGAALVVAGNGYLAERAVAAGARRVEVVPSIVDLERYALKESSSTQPVIIGWIGSPSTQEYLRLVAPALQRVCEHPNTRLVAVGANPFEVKGLDPKFLPWSEDSEADLVASFDVGVMPLPDTPWARGKCGYKLIQYMACGLPVVASRVGANCQIVQEGFNGFLASTNEEWGNHLDLLCRDERLRAVMGKAGRKTVESRYCLQVTAPLMLQLLQSVR